MYFGESVSCPGARSSKLLVPFRARKAVFVCMVCILDQGIDDFKNDQMKLSIDEAKLTGCELGSLIPETSANFNRLSLRKLRTATCPDSFTSYEGGDIVKARLVHWCERLLPTSLAMRRILMWV